MRIVSLAHSNTEILYAIGAADDIVAVTRFCDWPPEAKGKPKIGGWIDVNEKLVKELKPEIVVASTFLQDEIVSKLKKQGIKV